MRDDRPALLGGTPLRPNGEPRWPLRDRSVAEVLAELEATGAWGQYEGVYCEALERSLSERLSAVHVRTTASGTAAVEFALRGVGVRAGDEVVMAAWDFKANFVNIVALDAKPVLVDVRADDLQLDVDLVENALSEKTRAVLASHLHGSAVDIKSLRDICDQHGVALIEDACQMPLAEVHGRPAGMWGDAGIVSFGGSKTLSAGRGGAVFTNDRSVAQRMQLHDWRGNRLSPLSEMQAAILIPQIEQFDDRHQQRRKAVAWLRSNWETTCGLTMFPEPAGQTDFYKVPFRYDSAAFGGLPRERFCDAMHAEGVTMSPSFPALHLTHSPRRFRSIGDLANAAHAGAEVVVLHHPVLLENESAWQTVIDAVVKVGEHADELRAAAT